MIKTTENMTLPEPLPAEIRDEIDTMARLIAALGIQNLAILGSLYRPRRHLGCLPQLGLTWGSSPLIVKHVDPPVMVLVEEEGSCTTRIHLPIAILRMHPEIKRVSDELDAACPVMREWFRTQGDGTWAPWMFSQRYVWAVLEQTGPLSNCPDYVGSRVTFLPRTELEGESTQIDQIDDQPVALVQVLPPLPVAPGVRTATPVAKPVQPTQHIGISKRRSPKRNSNPSLLRFMASC